MGLNQLWKICTWTRYIYVMSLNQKDLSHPGSTVCLPDLCKFSTQCKCPVNYIAFENCGCRAARFVNNHRHSSEVLHQKSRVYCRNSANTTSKRHKTASCLSRMPMQMSWWTLHNFTVVIKMTGGTKALWKINWTCAKQHVLVSPHSSPGHRELHVWWCQAIDYNSPPLRRAEVFSEISLRTLSVPKSEQFSDSVAREKL